MLQRLTSVERRERLERETLSTESGKKHPKRNELAKRQWVCSALDQLCMCVDEDYVWNMVATVLLLGDWINSA